MINIFQFTKLDVSRFAKFVANAASIGANVVVDVEDSVQNPYHPHRTSILKKQTRDCITQVVSNGIENLSIRINSPATKEFLLDIAMMKHLSGYSWKYVFIPKCEKSQDIDLVMQVFKEENSTVASWIPIIETKVGVENLSHLLRALPTELVEYIAFGYSDFNYDAEYFPFYHENSAQYWLWVDEITSIAQDAHFKYLHSPFLRLHDADGFRKFLAQVSTRCPRGFAQTTLSPEQSSICTEFADTSSLSQKIEPMTLLSDVHYTDEECIELAQNLVVRWEESPTEKSLVFDVNNERLIAPHEYLAAKRFLLSVNSKDYGSRYTI